MAQTETHRPSAIYAIVAWMILSIIIVTLSILSGDTADLNNWIEIALWITLIAGVPIHEEMGFRLAIFTLSYTLSTSSMSNAIYYGIWINPSEL